MTCERVSLKWREGGECLKEFLYYCDLPVISAILSQNEYHIHEQPDRVRSGHRIRADGHGRFLVARDQQLDRTLEQLLDYYRY